MSAHERELQLRNEVQTRHDCEGDDEHIQQVPHVPRLHLCSKLLVLGWYRAVPLAVGVPPSNCRHASQAAVASEVLVHETDRGQQSPPPIRTRWAFRDIHSSAQSCMVDRAGWLDIRPAAEYEVECDAVIRFLVRTYRNTATAMMRQIVPRTLRESLSPFSRTTSF